MKKFFLFSLVFFAVAPRAVEAQTVKVTDDMEKGCPFGQPFFIGPMDTGKSFELLPGHTKAEKAKIEAHRQVLTKCVSQYGKRTKFVLVGFVDPVLYQGRPEVHNGLNGGLAVTRAISAARLMRALGYEFTTTREVHGEDGERGVLVIPDLGLCTAEDINGATRIVDEITGQQLSKSSCKAITGQQLPAGRITKVKISLMGEETFDGSGKSVGLPTTKTCYVVVGDGGFKSEESPESPAPRPGQPPKETKCSDGLDNDGDGLTDCADPDCEGSAVCGPEDTEARCKDGVDNDGDGFVDCEDKDCIGFCDQPPVHKPDKKERNCSDGLDNDNDGLTDCEDPDCKGIFSSCSKFQFFVSGELRFGILDKSESGPFHGVSEVTDQIKTSDMMNGALTIGAYYPVKNGWSVGLELGGVTATNLYAYMGETKLRGNVHQKMFLVRGGVLKQLNDFAVGLQLGSYLDGDSYVPVVRLPLQISITKNLKFEVGFSVENTRHVQTHENVWTPQIGVGLVYWF